MVLARLRQLMWSDVGIFRTEDGLQAALHQIQVMERRCLSGAPVLRQLLVARLMVEACLRRRESIGAHFLADSAIGFTGPAHGQAVA
ncbi:MAG: hypothetical protein R3F18_08705 [Lysobacterales bacterium]